MSPSPDTRPTPHTRFPDPSRAASGHRHRQPCTAMSFRVQNHRFEETALLSSRVILDVLAVLVRAGRLGKKAAL